MLSKYSDVEDAINNIILNILLLLFYNVFKTLKGKYLFNPFHDTGLFL